jgi:prepilin-type N-terminal cleavage/methylation domain-containing protein
MLTPSMRNERGFSLTELMLTVAVFATLMAIAVPVLRDMSESQRLGASTRELERELQTARMKSVSTNRPLRVFTNCPREGQFRMVEVIGTADDTRVDRCDLTAFPFPAADADPNTRPNYDGPVRYLQRDVTVPTMGFEFLSNGTVHTMDMATRTPELMGVPVTITVSKGQSSKTISINNMGKIRVEAY